VLTAENLRSELLELWHKKTIPTQSIFIVTHNIEEALLLADRIIVLGRNPGARAGGFCGDSDPAARPQERRLYPVGGLHLQGAHPAGRGPFRRTAEDGSARSAADALPDASPRAGPEALPACWNC